MQKGHLIKVLDKGYVRLVDWMGTDARIAEAARVSYAEYQEGKLVAKDRTPEQDFKLLQTLYKNKHTSPFEMCKITMDFKMPIFVARQYVRHRMQNLNEFSMRYKEAPDEFYVPAEWRVQDVKNKQGSNLVEGGFNPKILNQALSSESQTASEHVAGFDGLSFDLYKSMIGANIAREMARMVLPLNLYTYFYATWDIKNLLHFITLREDAHAQAEIQEYGKAVKTILEDLFPLTLECYERYKFICVDLLDPTAIVDEIARLQVAYSQIKQRKCGVEPQMVAFPITGQGKLVFKGASAK
jgi:thymidylate synthase (FAD)